MSFTSMSKYDSGQEYMKGLTNDVVHCYCEKFGFDVFYLDGWLQINQNAFFVLCVRNDKGMCLCPSTKYKYSAITTGKIFQITV